jgi:hypothetical protein
MTSLRTDAVLMTLGAAMLVAAVAWWALAFQTVVRLDYLGLPQALRCSVAGGSLCQLALSLCSGVHPLGIRSYSPALLWVGLAVFSGGMLARGWRA